MIAEWSSSDAVLTCALVAALVGSIVALVWHQCAKKEFHPLRKAATWFCRLPWLAKLVVVPSVAIGVAIGGGKAPTNNPPSRFNAPRLVQVEQQEPTNVVALTQNQLDALLALVRVGTNELWSFAPSTNAVVWEKLLKRGAANDVQV